MADTMIAAYWAVIPAPILDDPDLPDSAKLLYVRVSSLCKEDGYCWAGNKFLADRMGCSVPTIQRLLRVLSDKGFVRVEVERDPVTNAYVQRRIFAGVTACPPPLKNEGTPPLKNEVPLKEEILYTQGQNITPLNPPKGGERKSKYTLAEDAKPILRAYCGKDNILAKKLADFILMREQLRAINSKTAIVALLNKLDNLSGGDRDSKIHLIDESLANSWKSVFPLHRRDDLPGKPPDDGGTVERRDLTQW